MFFGRYFANVVAWPLNSAAVETRSGGMVILVLKHDPAGGDKVAATGSSGVPDNPATTSNYLDDPGTGCQA